MMKRCLQPQSWSRAQTHFSVLMLSLWLTLLVLPLSGASHLFDLQSNRRVATTIPPWGMSRHAVFVSIRGGSSEYDEEGKNQEGSDASVNGEQSVDQGEDDVSLDLHEIAQEEQQVVDRVANGTETEATEEELHQESEEAEPSIEIQSFISAEDVKDQEGVSFATGAVVDDPSIDDDSSAFVDRMELADDEGDLTPGSFEVESTATVTANTQDSLPSPVIDEAIRSILVKELKYSRREVGAMKPEIAVMVAEKRLFRPQEGMPLNWYIDGVKPFDRKELLKLLPKILIGVAIAVAIALAGGSLASKEVESPYQVPLADILPLIDETPAELVEKEDEIPLIHVNEHVDSLGDIHPHSIKPGERPNDEVDVTWLDKAITAVEKTIKSLLRMEL